MGAGFVGCVKIRIRLEAWLGVEDEVNVEGLGCEMDLLDEEMRCAIGLCQ